jgi:hypothetical protein
MGSPAAAALIAHAAFWGLLLFGLATRELSPQAGGWFLGLWLAAFFLGAYRPFWLPFSSCVAILDVALVFAVVKGDVRLS